MRFSPASATALPMAIFMTLLSNMAFGGVVEVRPTTLLITPSQKVGILSLENPEDTAAIYQVSVYSWHQKGDEQVLEPSDEVIASPPIISLPAHGSQIIRVGLRGAIPVEEHTYRLILDEVVSPNTPHKPGLNIALRLSLPLFVRSQIDKPPARLDARLSLADRKATVIIHNDGRFTARALQAALHAPALSDPDGITTQRLTYILPDGWVSYSFPLPAGTGQLHDATVTLQTDDGSVDLPAPLASEAASDEPAPPLR